MYRKRCFKCSRRKPISAFYRHPEMADGHLNKCKDCTKADMRTHRATHLARIQAYDRKRGNLPHRVAARRVYSATPRGNAAHARANARYRFRNGRRS